MPRVFCIVFLGLLAGCEQHASHTETRTDAPVIAPAPVVPATATAKPVDAEEVLLQKPTWEPPAATDTLLTLQGRHYRLRMQSEMDSTELLTTLEKSPSNPPLRVRGYEGRFTITLRDSLNRLVFKRQLHKADFFKRVDEVVVVQSGVGAPVLLGYSAPMGALIVTLGFAVPETDWGSQVVVLLDLKGQVLRMSDGDDYGGGPDIEPTLSADGRTLLTASEILRANQPPISLQMPHAELRGAFLLNDTAVVMVYELGDRRRVRNGQGQWEEPLVATKAQQMAPNAFVRHTRTNNVLSRFHYTGYAEELGYIIPRFYVPAAHTWYLLDERKGLLLLPNRAPDAPATRLFTAMSKFSPPQRATEVRMEKQGLGNQFTFYIDTLAPGRIRYQLLSQAE